MTTLGKWDDISVVNESPTLCNLVTPVRVIFKSLCYFNRENELE